MVPLSGGQFVFVRRALGRFPGFLVGWSDWISTCGTAAAVAIVLGEYAGPLIPPLEGHAALVASGVVLTFALLQWRGIRVGDAAQQLTSFLKALALLGLVAAILILPFDAAPPVAAAPLSSGLALLTAFVIAFQAVIFTYDGWTGAIYFGEEMKDPGRSIPRATIGGVLVVIALYLALNLAFLRAVAIGDMAGDPFVAATAATVVFGAHGDTVIRLLMIVSLLAAVSANVLIASRVPLAMARDRLLPSIATRVNEGGTPTTALFLGTGLALLLIATNTFDTILALLAFFFVANYALSFASVFVLRRREPGTPRPFRVIGYPWTTGLALAGSIAFLVAALIGDPGNSLRSLLLLAASVPVFLLTRGRESSE